MLWLTGTCATPGSSLRHHHLVARDSQMSYCLCCTFLQGPFSAVVEQHVRDPWLKSMLDLECFVLSGMLA
jgi:hypothetical protein